jgi:hypothetical protein
MLWHPESVPSSFDAFSCVFPKADVVEAFHDHR